jgi:hypothetical protein
MGTTLESKIEWADGSNGSFELNQGRFENKTMNRDLRMYDF